jgi:hypothetical protein
MCHRSTKRIFSETIGVAELAGHPVYQMAIFIAPLTDKREKGHV